MEARFSQVHYRPHLPGAKVHLSGADCPPKSRGFGKQSTYNTGAVVIKDSVL